MSIGIDLFLATISRVVILSIFSIYFMRRWLQSEKRFYSDFPFLIAVTMIMLAVAKTYDIWLYDYIGTLDLELFTGTDPYYMLLARIRFLLIIANTLPLFFITVNIWFNEKTKTKYTLVISFPAIWVIYILLVPNYTYLKNAIAFMILPLCIISVVTYLFLYKNQRLPEIHSLIIGLAWLGYIVSSLIRPFLIETGPAPWGYTWIAEFIDVVIWSVMCLGYIIKPPYYHATKTDMF